jgi:hypothetical protein
VEELVTRSELALPRLSLACDYFDRSCDLGNNMISQACVDPAMVSGALTPATGPELPEDFLALASRLGGAKADLRSHLNVSFNAVRQ